VVRRQRLLRVVMRLLLPLLLLACDAAELGVQLPQGGTDAIQVDDLQRDLWTLTDPRLGGRAPGSSGARRVAQAVGKRFRHAHLTPAFGDSYRYDLGVDRGEMVCGIRPGSSEGALAIVALDPGIGTLSAVPVAGLLGLAQAFDGTANRSRPVIMCLLPESGGLNGYAQHPPHPLVDTSRFVILGSLTGGNLRTDAGPEIVGLRSQIMHTGPIAADLGDDMGKVDFGRLSAQVRTAYLTLSKGR